ncbi:hybrid signal transduction histidine kinase A isoform X1 [Drosophila tropicalis]|uniref:hybrid signal transduction histidine kinase A isoform X1 n=1 Tax=Drosophila tropicalis TaxID=46794 RepID=UPI0035AC10A5
MPNSLPIHPLLLILLLPGAAWSGSCREAQLCCNGRDSSCVVQKAPINAIIEDLSDKPCYCDHACLKLGDCCDDFKDHCGENENFLLLDCQVSDWGAWSECDKSCGTGMMTRTRQILQAAQNGGKHCPSLLQKRGCQGYRCHGHRDKKILREMALLLPAALSRNRHANDSSDIRRNLRTRYHDSYKHNRDHEYCVEFEVIKASKACHKLPPYNLMLEGDRITVRCDLEALIQDSTVSSTTSKSNVYATSTTMATTTTLPHKSPENSNEDENNNNNNNNNNNSDDEDNEELEEDDDEDDAQNMLDTGSNESYEYRHQRVLPVGSHQRQRSATSKRSAAAIPLTTTTATPPISYHCRGEGLSGRTTRWSALAAPSCRGKWLRLTVGPPKKCNHAQFIFV